MSDSYFQYIDSVGIAAAQTALNRRVEPSEYMAIHVAIKAMVEAVVLVPSMHAETTK
jgi:hypothetical protein